MFFALPFISEYSAKVQIGILSVLLLASYLNRRARIAIAGLASVYLAFKILGPLVRWLWYLFKGIAWLGFYIHYFQVAIGFALTAIAFVSNDGLDILIRELDSRERNRATREDGAD
ncbi:hypothetical protein M413DRAFT_242357 [Hebeloma cylindrosporum]|uniref:Uncharacterized protein n=1 Tax=Hebeloma cylindrosporum TaxID=76867 RepID=A0A0C2YBX2_HEBCY|nr:hypothetical protein M413DRAFT_242357 [Hebeloma cylindrosporum h7]